MYSFFKKTFYILISCLFSTASFAATFKLPSQSTAAGDDLTGLTTTTCLIAGPLFSFLEIFFYGVVACLILYAGWSYKQSREVGQTLAILGVAIAVLVMGAFLFSMGEQSLSVMCP